MWSAYGIFKLFLLSHLNTLILFLESILCILMLEMHSSVESFKKNFIEVSWFAMLCLISAVQQSDSVIHKYVFSHSFPLWFITGYWILFPGLYSRTLLFIYPICNSLHTNANYFISMKQKQTHKLKLHL